MADFPKIRPIEEQFETERVSKIREIQGQFQSLRFQTGAGPYYTKEIIRCLEAGLLLAALHVAAAVLEVFVSDLLIAVKYKEEFPQKPTPVDSGLNKIERGIEDGRSRLDFSRIVSELAKRKIIDKQDRDKIYDFYKSVRIPIHHGLTRRFVRLSSKLKIDDKDDNPFTSLLIGQFSRDFQIEEVLEDDTLDHLATVGGFMKKYSSLHIDHLYSD